MQDTTWLEQSDPRHPLFKLTGLSLRIQNFRDRVGAEKSLADEMEKFAGCNCYFLLVGVSSKHYQRGYCMKLHSRGQPPHAILAPKMPDHLQVGLFKKEGTAFLGGAAFARRVLQCQHHTPLPTKVVPAPDCELCMPAGLPLPTQVKSIIAKNKEINWPGIRDEDNWEKQKVRETLQKIKAAGFNVIRMWAFNDTLAANEGEERRLRGEGALQMRPGEDRLAAEAWYFSNEQTKSQTPAGQPPLSNSIPRGRCLCLCSVCGATCSTTLLPTHRLHHGAKREGRVYVG